MATEHAAVAGPVERRVMQRLVAHKWRLKMDKYKPVCWFKHGPYEGDEPLQCVFDDPQDSDCFSPLFGGPLAESALAMLTTLLGLLADDDVTTMIGTDATKRLQAVVNRAVGAA